MVVDVSDQSDIEHDEMDLFGGCVFAVSNTAFDYMEKEYRDFSQQFPHE